jgi:hypothetical protein
MTSALISGPIIAAERLLRQGGAWWIGELLQLLPQQLLRMTYRLGGTGAVLEFAGDQATLLIPARGRAGATSLPVAGVDSSQLRSRIRATLRGAGASSVVVIRLDKGHVFETDIDLPLAAERSLSQILQHQLERLVPLDPAEVCFQARVITRTPACNILKVHIAITRQTTLNQAITLAEGLGLVPRAITAAPSGVVAAAGVDTLPFVFWQAGGSRTTPPARRRVLRALEVSAALLAVTAYGLYVYRLDQVRTSLRQEVTQARQAAAAVQTLGQEVRRLEKTVALLQSKRQTSVALQSLDETTQVIPQDAWAFQFIIHGHTVELVGYAHRASDLIGRIEGSPLFEKPRFRAPITLGPDGKGEHFELSFDIKSRDAP